MYLKSYIPPVAVKTLLYLYLYVSMYICVSCCDKHTAALLIIAVQTRAHRKQPYAQAKTIPSSHRHR